MLKVLQPNMHLRICGGSSTRQYLSDRCSRFWKPQLYLHLPCFLFSSISILFSLRFSSLTFFCLRRFLFSNSSSSLERNVYNRQLQSIKSAAVNSHHEKRRSVRTCERVHSFFGQDWRLQGQLTDAELARERQMSQITMPTTDLLQQSKA